MAVLGGACQDGSVRKVKRSQMNAMANALPAYQKIFEFGQRLDDIERGIVWPLKTIAVPQLQPKGLLAFGPDVLTSIQIEDHSRLPDSTLAELNRLFSTHPAGRWLVADGRISTFDRALSRKAKLGASRFAEPAAKIWLYRAIAMGLFTWAHYKQRGTSPQQPKTDDWRKIKRALETIKEAESDFGLSLRNAMGSEGRLLLPHDWVDRMLTAVRQAKYGKKKAHADENLLERVACKTFTQWLLIYFAEAPPTWVEKFGHLIGYDAKSLADRHLPSWLTEFNEHSIT